MDHEMKLGCKFRIENFLEQYVVFSYYSSEKVVCILVDFFLQHYRYDMISLNSNHTSYFSFGKLPFLMRDRKLISIYGDL